MNLKAKQGEEIFLKKSRNKGIPGNWAERIEKWKGSDEFVIGRVRGEFWKRKRGGEEDTACC